MILWAATLALCVLVVFLLIGPGACIVSILDSRPAVILGAAPAVTVFLINAMGLLYALIGLRWSAVTGLAGLMTVSVACILARRLIVRYESSGRHTRPPDLLSGIAQMVRASVIAALPAIALQVAVLIANMKRPIEVLQNHDAMFHLNLIVDVGRTGDASLMGATSEITGGSIYPAVFHAIAALLLGVVNAPSAFNAVAIAIGAMLFPLLVALALHVMGCPRWVCAIGALAAQASAWMPAVTLYFHAQVAAGLAVAILPGALAAQKILHEEPQGRGGRGLVITAMLVAGAASAHPGAGQWLIVVLCILAAAGRLSRAIAARTEGLRPCLMELGRAGVILTPVLIMPVSQTLRQMATFPREDGGVSEVLLQVLSGSPPSGFQWSSVPIVVLAWAGAVCLLRARAWLLPSLWLVSMGLAVLTVLPAGRWKALTGAWWADPGRYLAIQVVVAAVLAAIGCERLVAIWRGSTRLAPFLRRWGARGGAAALAAFLTSNTVQHGWWVKSAYQPEFLIHPAWVSDAEFDRLVNDAGEVFDESMVYGVPATGAGLVPVVTDGMSMFRYEGNLMAEDQIYLAEHFRDIRTDPRVCEIIRSLGGIPLYYEDSALDSARYDQRYPGFVDVDTADGFEFVDSLDTASVWRITACD